MLNQGIQLYMAVAVSVGGLALWWSLQSPMRQRPQFESMDAFIEKERHEIAQTAVLNNPKWEIDRQVRREAIPQAAAGQNAPTQPVDVTDATFSSVVLGSDVPVLVDFGAEWCGACRMIEPSIHELASELGGRAVVAQVDVDANPQIAARYGIEALPTLLVFKNGEVVDGVVGAASKAELRSKVEAQSGPSGTLL